MSSFLPTFWEPQSRQVKGAVLALGAQPEDEQEVVEGKGHRPPGPEEWLWVLPPTRAACWKHITFFSRVPSRISPPLIHTPVTPITFYIRDRLLRGDADSAASGRRQTKGVGMILPRGMLCLSLC